MEKNCLELFTDYFHKYKASQGKIYLTFDVTCGDKPEHGAGWPHGVAGNAIDIILRVNGDYSGIAEYNQLFAHMLHNWPYRAGLDNTYWETVKGEHPNVHIHIDLNRHQPAGKMPFFFIEDGGRYQREVVKESEIWPY